jgi:hypothetical protein
MTDTNPSKETYNADLEIIFLGVAERAALAHDGFTNLFKWNVLGLKNNIISYVYPLSLSNFCFGVAINVESEGKIHKLSLVDNSNSEIGSFNLSAQSEPPPEFEKVVNKENPILLKPNKGWVTIFLTINDSKLLISKPGLIQICCETQNGKKIIGELQFFLTDPSPLTRERIAAIRSDPTAMKAVRLELKCNFCESKFRTYAALEKNEKLEREGIIWYENIPDQFLCECGKTIFPLDLYRKNLHGFIGINQPSNENFNFLPLYERSSLETLKSTFAHLIQSKPKEERLQEFLNENPILLHQFTSSKLFSKPPILTSFFADFAILTSNKELILIELEKTATKLMKKDGGVAAELNHAFDQVHSWLHVVDEHRLAVLESLKINKEDVSSVRGVVIAGLDSGYDAHHLRILKGEDRGRISFYTYDDLLFALEALIRKISAL